MEKHFNINILGQELSVVTDSGDEHVARVVKYVNDKVEEVGKTSNNSNTLNVVILVALNIADEYFKFTEQIRNENYRLGLTKRVVTSLESFSYKLHAMLTYRQIALQKGL